MLPSFSPPHLPTVNISASRLDSFYLHQAAVSHGYVTTIFPGEVLVVTRGSAGQVSAGEVAFVQGVPPSATLAGVSFTQERRIRRALLQRAGLPVPRGATFSLRRGLNAARVFASKIGYPVSVKAARGAATTEVFDELRNASEVAQAITYFETAPVSRPRYVRGVIAPPEFKVEQVDGKDVLPLSQRVLVEKFVVGLYLRCLVVEGKLHSAVLCHAGPWSDDPESYQDVSDVLHPSIRRLCLEVADTIPGIRTAAVDVRVESVDRHLDSQTVNVVEVGEQPLLFVQHMLGESRAEGAATEIFRASLELRHDRSLLSDNSRFKLVAYGVSDTNRFATGLSDLLKGFSAYFETHAVDEVSGVLKGTITGTPSLLAYLGSIALDEGVGEARDRCTMLRIAPAS